MFKSIFSRYMITFLVIDIIILLASTSLVAILLRQYDAQDKFTVLQNISETTIELIEEDNADELDIDSYLEDNHERLSRVLKAVAANEDHTVILICNTEGQLALVCGNEIETRQFTSGSSSSTTGGVSRISKQFLTKVDNENNIKDNAKIDGLFNEDHYYFAKEIIDSKGAFRGAVISFFVTATMDDQLELIIRTVVIVAFVMAVASIVAAFIITRRNVAPLAKMSEVASDFSKGNFEARVPEKGNDEISELARSFNSMADSMQRLEESRRLFLSNVSHDLRTPMTSIKGFIDSILSGAIPEEQVPHYLEVVSSEIRRLSRLVSSLMDITKIEAGEKHFVMKQFDICEMARQVIISFEQKLEEKKLDVIFDAEEDNMYVMGDRDAIYQVMYNLCDNAIKFSRERGLYEVELRNIDRGSKVRFSIYNEGQGISKEDLPFVFERFYKSDRSRGIDKTGVGLGLYISQTIIEQHGGKIKVESEEGKWCRFEFALSKEIDTTPERVEEETPAKAGRWKKNK